MARVDSSSAGSILSSPKLSALSIRNNALTHRKRTFLAYTATVKLHFFGANRQVTGSCYCLEAGGLRIGIDCGMFQERKFQKRNWNPLPLNAASLDVLLLTHAHLDHCGLLPKLVHEGFSGRILTTSPSIELAEVVMQDSARIQKEDVAYKQRRHAKARKKSRHKYEPLYRMADVEQAVSQMQRVNYDETIELGGGVRVRFREAGHILGSAMLDMIVEERGQSRRIVFSGDIGQWDVPIVGDPTDIQRADYLILESTYGDEDHERTEGIEEQLADVVNRTIRRGGHIVIPTFAIERAQELLLRLAENIHSGRMQGVKIFLDSPMAINVTEIFLRYPDYMDEHARETLESRRLADAWNWVQMTRSSNDSRQINSVREPSIILAGSGMCTGGRIKHHLSLNLGRPESTILFVGYQAEETLGRRILDGDPEVRIFGRTLPVKAEVRQIQGLSAHAGRSDLLGWVDRFEEKPRRIMLTHGEEQAALSLAEALGERGHEVVVPEYLEQVDLD